MKISAKKAELFEVLQKVIRPINPRNPLPILTHIKFVAHKGKLELAATDLTISIKLTVPADIKEEGAVTIPAKRLLDIVREVSGSDAEIMLAADKQNHIKITCANTSSRWNMVGGAADEFPAIDIAKEKIRLKMAQETLHEMVQSTGFAASGADESRAYLTGINIVSKGKDLTLVATNSHKLALIQRQLESKQKTGSFNVIVPARAMLELIKGFDSENKEVDILITDNQIAFQDKQMLLTSRLIDETYPAYEKVIPQKKLKNNIKIDPIRLEEALRRVAIMCDEKTRMVRLSFSKNMLTLTGSSALAGGESTENMDVDYTKGDALEVAFNVEYLKEIVQQFSEGDMDLQLDDGSRPCLFKEPGDEGYLCLLMPMRI